FWLLMHQRGPLTACNPIAVMVEGFMEKRHDSVRRSGFTLALSKNRCPRADRIPMKHRVRESHIGHPEIADCGSKSGVGNAHANQQVKSKDTVDNWLAEFGFSSGMEVNMQRLGIQGLIAKGHIICLGDRAFHRMIKNHSFFEFLKP